MEIEKNFIFYTFRNGETAVFNLWSNDLFIVDNSFEHIFRNYSSKESKIDKILKDQILLLVSSGVLNNVEH